jgi:hypothetical protein
MLQTWNILKLERKLHLYEDTKLDRITICTKQYYLHVCYELSLGKADTAILIQACDPLPLTAAISAPICNY